MDASLEPLENGTRQCGETDDDACTDGWGRTSCHSSCSRVSVGREWVHERQACPPGLAVAMRAAPDNASLAAGMDGAVGYGRGDGGPGGSCNGVRSLVTERLSAATDGTLQADFAKVHPRRMQSEGYEGSTRLIVADSVDSALRYQSLMASRAKPVEQYCCCQ